MRVDRVLVQGDAGAAAPGTLNAYDAITQQLIGSTVVPANGAYTLQIQWQQLLSAIAAGLSGASAVPSQIPTLSLSAAVQAASSVGGAISGTLLIQAIAAGIGAGAGTPQYQVALQAVAQARSNGVGVSQAIAQGSLSGGVAGIGSGVDATLAVIMAMGGVSAGVGGAGGVVTYQQFLQGLGAGLVAAVDSSLVITGGATNAITTPASDGLSFNSPVTIAGTAAPGASIQLWDHGTYGAAPAIDSYFTGSGGPAGAVANVTGITSTATSGRIIVLVGHGADAANSLLYAVPLSLSVVCNATGSLSNLGSYLGHDQYGGSTGGVEVWTGTFSSKLNSASIAVTPDTTNNASGTTWVCVVLLSGAGATGALGSAFVDGSLGFSPLQCGITPQATASMILAIGCDYWTGTATPVTPLSGQTVLVDRLDPPDPGAHYWVQYLPSTANTSPVTMGISAPNMSGEIIAIEVKHS